MALSEKKAHFCAFIQNHKHFFLARRSCDTWSSLPRPSYTWHMLVKWKKYLLSIPVLRFKFKPSCTCFSCLFAPLVVLYIKSWPIDCTSHDNRSVVFHLLDKMLINNFLNFGGIRTSDVYNSSIDGGHFVNVFRWSSISFHISFAAFLVLLLWSLPKFHSNAFSVGTSSLKTISPFPGGAQKHSLYQNELSVYFSDF